MAHLNLIASCWIPALRQDGSRQKIRPADLVDRFSTNPVVDIVWPRADLRVATFEFLIGLLSTACPPDDIGAWRRWRDAPPSPDALAEIFAPFESAFDFDGAGPRFLQEFGELEAEASPVSALLIEQPGANTIKNNSDLFIKRGKVEVLGRSTAAVALYALQSFAPSGGAGHRTGLRGGGPLTTLAHSAHNSSLWDFLWLNTVAPPAPDETEDPREKLEKVFPWLAPTRVSDKSGRATTPRDMHPTQCFWGMPRRIQLDFEDNINRLPCAITGEVEEVIVRSYRTRPYGVNYQNALHVLSPYYQVKKGAEWLPVHPQPGGLAYRHWLGFVSDGELRKAAICVTTATRRLRASREPTKLRLYGYDMDNMKARGLIEAERPLFIVAPEIETQFHGLIERLIEGAREVVSLMAGAIRDARHGGAGEELSLAREEFYAETEAAFFSTVEQALGDVEKAPEQDFAAFRKKWLDDVLAPQAKKIFDQKISLLALAEASEIKGLERAIKARRMLGIALAGHGKSGTKLMTALALGAPVKKARKGGAK